MTTFLFPVLLAAVFQGPATVDRPTHAVVDHCVISLVSDGEAEVPAREAGVLMMLEAKEGMTVEKGQQLARIDDSDQQIAKKIAQREYDIAHEKAEDDVNKRFAEASFQVAVAEVDQARAIRERSPQAITLQEMRRLELNAKKAELQIEVSIHEQNLAKISRDAHTAKVEQADVGIEKRVITSPISGVVVRVPRHLGEWVNPGDTVFHIVRMDTLRVEGYVNSREFAAHEIIGQPVTVEAHLARGLVAKLEGKIDYVSPLIESDGGYRVWTNVKNIQQGEHWVLGPGLPAKMRIHVKPAAVAAVK